MTPRRLVALAAASLMLAAGMAQAQSFDADGLSESIRIISQDEFQGRYPGTEGERLTLEWLQAQYEALGLEPGGREGQWLQPVNLARYTPDVEAASLVWTGADGQERSLVIQEEVTVRSVANDGQAQIQAAEVVFAGYGIVAPERGWDDYGDVDVAGKLVMVVNGEPAGELFNGDYATQYQSQAYKADEAARRGALGLIVVHPGDAGSGSWQRARWGGMRTRTLAPGAADLEIIAAMPAGLAEELALGLTQMMAGIEDGDFKAQTLDGARLSVTAGEILDWLKTHNLIAKFPGQTYPDETIIYSAHWDHVGVNDNALGEDKIFNGAWDNASGTVALVEMARSLKQQAPFERTLVFLHLTAEEMGLLGSYAYTADPVYPLETTVANINIDMLPLSGPTRDVPIFGLGQNSLEDSLADLAQAQGRYVSSDNMPEQGFYYRSDHYPFARAGVPALMPWHGWDWVEGGREAGEAAWRQRFGQDYHGPSDEWSPDLDFRAAIENLTLLHQLGANLANNREWPQWKPSSEFGQVRARSEAARALSE